MNLFIIYLSVHKWAWSCNTIDKPDAWICVPNSVENVNDNIFNVRGKWNEIFSAAWIVWV